MGVEIERKFLVRNEDWRPLVEKSETCIQGYVSIRGEGAIRIRLIGVKAFLTLKGPREGIRRSEFEYEIPRQDAKDLLRQFCEKQVISKVRHLLKYQGRLWEIDEFKEDNEGLILAEVELDFASQKVDLPSWIGREVSENERYFNARLSKCPFKTWSEKR